MTRSRRQLVLVLIISFGIAAIGSHLLASWLKVKTIAAEPFTIGKSDANPPAFLAGSSLADYGISWEQISAQLDLAIKVWGIAAASPYEEEQFQKQVPEARTTFIVVSAYDLDEAMICDFRAAIVPLGQTIQTLRTIHADWKEAKIALSQYPMTWLRTLFPTLGRSRGVMGKLREEVVRMVKRSSASSGTEAGLTLDFGKEKGRDTYKLQRVSDWSNSQTVAKLVATRAGFQGEHGFNGPKNIAFGRMLQYGVQRGRTIIIVLPVSAAYSKEFISPKLAQEFEASLADAQHRAPRAEWLRLDQLPGLAADENFCDTVHMNEFGKQIATQAFQAWLKQPARQP